jgi:putative copper export protein
MLEVVAALVKFLLYAGVLSAAGLAFAAPMLGARLGSVADLTPRLLRATATLALGAAIANFIVLVFRLGGEFNAPTLSAIAETPTGLAILLQVAGAIILLAARGGLPGLLLRLLGGTMLLASFAVSGHVSAIDTLSSAIAFLHVLAAAWWLGALLLLQPACARLAPDAMTKLIGLFGIFAMALVAILLVAGVVLVVTLVDFTQPEWLTPYAQSLLLKVVLALSVIALAAWNKLRITPRLANADSSGVRDLQHTIGIEIGLFTAVLFATAWLTTFNSPHMS